MPQLRARLTPDYPIGCKRVHDLGRLVSRTLARQLLARHRADRARRGNGIVTADGKLHEADTLVFATGFDSTSFLAPMQIVGPAGTALKTHGARRRSPSRRARERLPESVPALRTEHEPRPQLDLVHARVPGPLRHALPRRARAPRRTLHRRQTRGDGALERRAPSGAGRDDVGGGLFELVQDDDGKITNNWSGRTTAYWRATRNPNFDELDVR